MSSKLNVKCQKDDTGRLNWIEIRKGRRRKPLRMDFVWDSDHLTREIEFSGRRQDMPSLADIMLMFNESFIERIGVVKLINLIEKIEQIELIDLITKISEITTIKNIETIGKDNISSCRAEKALNPAADSEAYDTEQTGPGKLVFVIFSTITVGGRDNLRPRIQIDGEQKMVHDMNFANWHFYVSDANEGIAIGVYDTTNDFYTLIVTLNLRFHTSLKVGFFNEDAANAQAGTVGYIYDKIS